VDGKRLIKLYRSNSVEASRFWVGRGQGVNGLAVDVSNDEWRERLYQTNASATEPPNKNWFSLADFAEAVRVSPTILHDLDRKMGKVRFLPWIGEHYQQRKWNGSLLILGESHYSVDDEDKYITRSLTSDYCSYKWSHPFWTNIMQVVSGLHHTEQDRAAFWKTVSFYNYIQESLDKARTAPDGQMWDDAKVPFVEVLNALNPDRIIVLGYRLWDWFDFNGKDSGAIVENGIKLNLWSVVRSDGGTTLCGCLKHPSSGFSSETWAPVVKRFIEK
jgi:hypothetical protein